LPRFPYKLLTPFFGDNVYSKNFRSIAKFMPLLFLGVSVLAQAAPPADNP
jgi:hypothetical protein